VRIRPGSRVAVVGAGPSGLVAAKEALEAGFEPTVFEASDDLGGQWHSAAAHSGIWPGMRTNTSRAMTAFSDFPPPADHPLHPLAEQIHSYLRAYAAHFGVTDRIRLNTPVTSLRRGWIVNGEPYDAVVIASGRFVRPNLVAGLDRFGGEVLHAFDYPGAEMFRDRRTLVYGNGISGHEIASDLAVEAPVVSAYRKPRYVIQKVVDGVPSDWQWYSQFGVLLRRSLPPQAFGEWLRERVIRVAGHPSDYGAPEPDRDITIAGLSLCQDYLAQVRAGAIACRPAIAAVDGARVTFVDGSTEVFEAIVCATGYDLDLPYLDDELASVLGPDCALYQRTLHPDLAGLGVVGMFAAQGPYFGLLELQARWIVGVWSGTVVGPDPARMRAAIFGPQPALNPHNVLAQALAEELGVTPDRSARPDLAEALLFGPMLASRYRLDGPGARPDAAEQFRSQLATSSRAPVEAADLEALERLEPLGR
jgi:dimethylaniline monooxygenase (N-oxide forming)